MEIYFPPDLEARLHALAAQTGRAPDELVQDAMTSYFQSLAQVRELLDGRYDDVKRGLVQPIDGEEARSRLLAQNDEARQRNGA